MAVLVLAVLAMIDLLYYTAPNVQLKQRGFRWVTKGALLALVVRVLASAALRFTCRRSVPTARHTAPSPGSSCCRSGCG
jgi:uncharacterized BrkB/YihY/UPF0761 family membrane protein